VGSFVDRVGFLIIKPLRRFFFQKLYGTVFNCIGFIFYVPTRYRRDGCGKWFLKHSGFSENWVGFIIVMFLVLLFKIQYGKGDDLKTSVYLITYIIGSMLGSCNMSLKFWSCQEALLWFSLYQPFISIGV